MSNEIDRTNNSDSNSARATDLEDKSESAVGSLSTKFDDCELTSSDEERPRSKASLTASEKELEAEEKARIDKIVYERALQDKVPWDGTYQPGIDGNDLVQMTNGVEVVSQDWWTNRPKNAVFCLYNAEQAKTPLCHSCGWGFMEQTSPHPYTSRLKIFLLKPDYGMWEAGPKWFIRDEINNDWNAPGNDYKAQQLVRQSFPEVPLVEMHRFGDKEDKYALTVMARAKGIEYSKIHDALTTQQKVIIAEDLTGHILKWRKLTAPRMQTADGKPLRDFIFRCSGVSLCQDVPFDTTEWVKKRVPAWRKALLYKKFRWKADHWMGDPPRVQFPRSWLREVDEKVAKAEKVLLDDFSSSKEEFVFTHGDLNEGNIFVFEETPGIFKISAIIDWEFAGYCPWWVEPVFEMSGIFHDGRQEILVSGQDMERFKTISSALYDIIEAGLYHGDAVFDHSPSEMDMWIGREFCKCRPVYRAFQEILGPKRTHTTTSFPPHDMPDDPYNTAFQLCWNNLVESEGSKEESR